MKEDSVAECMDCGVEYTFTRPAMRTHAEYLKKRRCRKCGHFALKAKNLDL